MSFSSVNLLRERIIRAAMECADELEDIGSGLMTTRAKKLVRAVKALREETHRIDEAPALIKELLHIIELQPEATSMLGAKIRNGTQEGVLRAKAFLGERSVEDETAPVPQRRRPLRKLQGPG